MSFDQITHCKIYPGIGIARLGNSPDAFFIGPEAPGSVPKPEGGFKDARRRIKRQAARFRIYAYNSTGQVVQELTVADADITWTVHLANKKASWHEFHGRYYAQRNPDHPLPPLRNRDTADRDKLIIDPGERSIMGSNQYGQRFDTGKFFETNVVLGELRTDESGRLLVLGGYGHSGTTKEDNPIHHYANNDYWFDDTSDGPVSAVVKLKGSTQALPVTSAWVLVTPPKFVPELNHIVTFYEVAEEVAITQQWLPASGEVSFTRDIYPILARVSNYPWVSSIASRGHNPGRRGYFLDDAILKQLADNSDAAKTARQDVFLRIRTPVPTLDIHYPPAEAVKQANYSYMPQLSGDDGDVTEDQPATWFTVLSSQYEKLQKWADGQFKADWTGTSPILPVFADIAVQDQPAALERAALEPCVGGPFFPGIEITFISTDKNIYSEAFRLQPTLQAGDITKYMAVPWQADFYECETHWWPVQRPDDVVPESEYHKIRETWKTNDVHADTMAQLLAYRQPWARGVGEQSIYWLPNETPDEHERRVAHAGDNDLVEKWSQLGFVVTQQTPEGEVIFVETERTPNLGLSQREFFYKLLNVEANPELIPKARSLANDFLKQAWNLQNHPDFPDNLRFFSYSKEAFEARLGRIYQDLVNEAEAYNPADDPFKTRADVLQRIYQMAPFNLLDGVWLRNITQAGPINDIHALLFSIWMDEVGDGDPGLNHSNIYNDLLHSVGIYLSDVNSRTFAEDPKMLDSAYTVPLFELAISQWSKEFFPELLGMTLQLEWEVVSIKPIIKLLDYFGISAHFYRMHVGIDNASEGHGAKAKEAVQDYLDQVFQASGEEEAQKLWQRIWNGYIAFSTTGTLGNDIYNLIKHPVSLDQQVSDMIERKKPYARLNHSNKKLGDNYINDWFEDSKAFAQELIASGLMVPGNPDNSPFFNLLSFTGPMYKVFTDQEIKLWQDWLRSQGNEPPPPSPNDPATAMIDLIDLLRPRQTGQEAHQTHMLSGPNPLNPSVQITQPVAWWFTQKTTDLMQALANEQNGWIKKGEPANSPFITQLLSPAHPMGQAFSGIVPNTGNQTGLQVATSWIAAGCPIPLVHSSVRPRASLASFGIKAFRLSASTDQGGGITPYVPKTIFGMGAVH